MGGGVCECSLVYVGVDVCEFTSTLCVCTRRSQRSTPGMFLDGSPPYFLRQSLSLNLESNY